VLEQIIERAQKFPSLAAPPRWSEQRTPLVVIGALSVGRIVQVHPADTPFQRGEEKSVFRFGGSAIVVFGEPERFSQCIGASPMATSIRVLGAEDSTLPCGSGCRIGRRCSIPATSTTRCSCPSCCTAAHCDIPAVVEAMRQYWMPTRYARAS
jgi:Phosphatidylserine decarboxylase